ncbi:uncharacterized protein TNCV_4501001 [Trichonephila clavipes]|nr:uncharacterized protein TNCV_4501001 [Trichonephila clavipes]
MRFLVRVELQDESPWNIMRTDEAHFHLEAGLTLTIAVLAGTNPHQLLQIPLHIPSNTVGSVKCIAAGQRCSSLLQQSVIPALQATRWDTTTAFIQDGAFPHVAHCVKQLCHFGDDRIISRHFHTAWPTTPADLNTCDFWLWGCLKTMMYHDPFTSTLCHWFTPFSSYQSMISQFGTMHSPDTPNPDFAIRLVEIELRFITPEDLSPYIYGAISKSLAPPQPRSVVGLCNQGLLGGAA